MRFFIISLNPEKSEARSLVDELKAEDIDVEFFSAVDGRQGIPVLKDGESIDQNKSINRHRAFLTSSEIGCYLSHYRLIKSAFEAGEKKICILEDDIGIEPGLGRVLQDVEALPENYEFVRLMGLKIGSRKVVHNLPGGAHLVRPLRGLQGTQGYVINRSGMRKVIRQGNNLGLPIDIFYDTFWETDLKCFAIEPHVIFEKDMGSSITKSHSLGIDRSFLTTLKWHFFKIVKSLRRLLYLYQFYSEFYPAQKPENKPGRTGRMK